MVIGVSLLVGMWSMFDGNFENVANGKFPKTSYFAVSYSTNKTKILNLYD